MAITDVDGSSLYRQTHSPSWLAWFEGWRLALSLRSSNKPSKLWQWLCYDDSTINIIVVLFGRIAVLCKCGLLLQMVCLSVCHYREPCKRGLTDRNAGWSVGSGGPKEDGNPDPHENGQF